MHFKELSLSATVPLFIGMILSLATMACGDPSTDVPSTPTTEVPPTPSLKSDAVSLGQAKPIEFDMRDNYRLGEEIEIRIRNNSEVNYIYPAQQDACQGLGFYYDSDGTEPQDGGTGEVTAEPGLFEVPKRAHCDLPGEKEIKPSEEVLLLTRRQEECGAQNGWRCIKSVPVKAGKYNVVEEFYESKGPVPENEGPYFEKGRKVVAEWIFTIE